MAKKRGNNEGTIRQMPTGSWQGRYTAYVEGVGKQKSVYDKTYEGCSRKLREAIHQIQNGEYVEPSQLTLGDWLDTWFHEYGRPHWKETTATANYQIINHSLKPVLGQHILQKLRPEHVQAFINKQVKDGLAPATIRRKMTCLQSALKQAVENQLILRNPAEHAKLPQAAQKEIKFLTVDEQQKLVNALPENTYGRGLRFILGTGLRSSELCGLRWIDIEGDYFTVRQSLHKVKDLDAPEGEKKSKLSVTSPKSKAGLRPIPLTNSMKALLEEQARTQRVEYLNAGTAWIGEIPDQGNAYVFTSIIGAPIDRNNLARILRNSLEAAGLEH